MGEERIIRIFPRRTSATPSDSLAVVNRPPGFFDEADRVHISVVFTWDIPRAERLAKDWACVAPVEIGGPAIGTKGGNFTPGLYLKHGWTITSRGCPNKCWFCQVWRRDCTTRELPIMDGWNIADDNLLACSPEHIKAVFAMLKRQVEYPRFSGGLEAKRLEAWHAGLLRESKACWIFFAYDSPDDFEPLKRAGAILESEGVSGSKRYCYVLCGYANDTFEKAEKRMREAWSAGFMPFAMLYRDKSGLYDKSWRRFQRQFVRPMIARSILENRTAVQV